MNELLVQENLPRLVVAGTAVAIGVLLLARGSGSNSTTCHELLQGKPARKIHVLKDTQPVLGNLVERLGNADRQFDWFLEKSLLTDGEPWLIKIPGMPEMIMFTLPEAIEEITANQFDFFPKGEFQIDCLLDMFGAGLVASDGARWLHQRKAAVNFFSAKVLRTLMMDCMQKNMELVYNVIDSKMETQRQVDLKQLFLEFTIETFAELGMGVRLNTIGAETPHPFQHALDVAAPTTSRRFRVPMFYWKAERWLGVGPEGQLAKHMKIVRDWLQETIQTSLQDASARKQAGDNSDVKSVIELFVEHGQNGAEGLQPDDLVDFLLTFVIASRDTTADTLAWFFYALSKNPEVERRLRQEMFEQLGDQHIPYLTTDHVKKLTYLEAAVKETLRLYPAAPFTVRQVAKDTVICDDILLRKGQMVGTFAWVMARHPRVWGPDAAEFNPDRWITPTGEIRQVPSSKFYTFSSGPRTCIGMKLAMLEMRIATANLLHRYKFEIDPSNDGSYEVAPTLNMKNPLFAKATRITRPRKE